jgi:hypothetical protein
MQTRLFGLTLAIASLLAGPSSAEMPAAIAAPGRPLSTTFHGEGAQIYECKSDSDGKPAWQIREPIATLLLDCKTVGRHHAGPTLSTLTGASCRQKWSATRLAQP